MDESVSSPHGQDGTGFDRSTLLLQVTNGANLFWAPQFGLNTEPGAVNGAQNEWLLGLTAGGELFDQARAGTRLTSLPP